MVETAESFSLFRGNASFVYACIDGFKGQGRAWHGITGKESTFSRRGPFFLFCFLGEGSLAYLGRQGRGGALGRTVQPNGVALCFFLSLALSFLTVNTDLPRSCRGSFLPFLLLVIREMKEKMCGGNRLYIQGWGWCRCCDALLHNAGGRAQGRREQTR